MDSYAKEIEDFKFIPLREPEETSRFKKSSKQNPDRRLRLTIGINGWLNDEEDVVKPWKVLGPETEVFALRYEMKTLLSLGTALTDLVQSFSWNVLKSEVIKRTVLATLWAALWPIQMLKIASNVDNPFSRASDRSTKAGQLLADALINKVQGERPVTLIGYSLGATAIHACLQSLAEHHAFGLVENVVIIGTPAPASPGHWRTLRTVVSGRIFNVFSENDMILGFVYRMHSLSLGVAGLQEIEGVQGIENLNLSDRVSGHLRYPSLTGGILRKCAFISAQGGDEIEKDDVIKMKDDYAQGNLIDFDGEDVKDDRADTKDAEDKMRDLKVSSTDFAHSDEQQPPLPRRPAGPTTVNEKPAASGESKRHSWDSQPSDNGSYKGVKMVDNDGGD
jgi:pimeloyl-ACP methyl ester carboxylesterase